MKNFKSQASGQHGLMGEKGLYDRMVKDGHIKKGDPVGKYTVITCTCTVCECKHRGEFFAPENEELPPVPPCVRCQSGFHCRNLRT